MDEGGAEFYQIYRFDLETGRHEMLTDGKSRNQPGAFDNQGNRIAFSSNRRNGRDFDIHIMDAGKPGTAELVYQDRGWWTVQNWSPDDQSLLISHYVSANESSLHILDLRTRRIRPLLAAETGPASDGPAMWSRDGKGVYLVSDRESEFRRLWYLDLASGKLSALTAHVPWDVESFDLTRDGSLLLFTANEDGISRAHLVNTATGRELPQPALPAGQITRIAFHPRLKEFGFSCVSARSPADSYSYNWETGKLTRWTSSEAGGLNPERFPATDLIRYPTFDQVAGRPRMIPAFVTRPPGRFKPPYPVVVSIHGGPEGQARPGLNSSYFLNEMGIALIHPNVRGSAGYGKSYLKLDNAMLREDSVKDIGALLDWIETQRDLDSKRVAVMGGSYGGYMTLASLTHYSSRLRCGIDVVGISNWATFLSNTSGYRQDLRRAEYGDERDPRMRDFFETISPLNNAAKIKVPLLVVQGRNDPRVPESESRQMVAKVRENGGTVWFVTALDEGHGFSRKANRDYQTWVEILFLEKYLLP